MPVQRQMLVSTLGLTMAMAVTTGFAWRDRHRSEMLPKKSDLALQKPLRVLLAGNGMGFINLVAGKTGQPTTDTIVSGVNCDSQNATNDHAVVTMTALDSSHFVAHRGDYDKVKGYLLAKIDVSVCDFSTINLTKGHTGYWVVDLDDNLMFQSHFIDMGTTQQPLRPPVDLAANKPWTFVECPQQHDIGQDIADVQVRALVCWAHENPDSAAAHLKKLGFSPSVIAGFRKRSGANILTRIDKSSKRYADDDLLIWIVCADGCCYADQQ